MSIWLLYLMTRTESLGAFLGVWAVVGLTAVIFTTVVAAATVSSGDMKEETGAAVKRFARRVAIGALVAGLASVLLPTRKDCCLMVGGYYVTHIEGIGQLPQNMVGAMNEFLREYGQEPERKGEAKGHGV